MERSAIRDRRAAGYFVPGLRGACHRAGHFGPDPLAPSGLQLATEIRERLWEGCCRQNLLRKCCRGVAGVDDVQACAVEILLAIGLEPGDHGVRELLIFAMILIGKLHCFPNRAMEYKGKAKTPLIGHVVSVIRDQVRLPVRRDVEMDGESPLEIPIGEGFMRLLIEEKSEELYEARVLRSHVRNHALDIMRAVKIIVVEMHDDLPICGTT